MEALKVDTRSKLLQATRKQALRVRSIADRDFACNSAMVEAILPCEAIFSVLLPTGALWLRHVLY
jgi:hypothetical protein